MKVGRETKGTKYRPRLPRAIADGSSRYISTGLDETPENFKKVQIVAWGIETDLINGTFDSSLERYRDAFKPKVTPVITKVNQVLDEIMRQRLGIISRKPSSSTIGPLPLAWMRPQTV